MSAASLLSAARCAPEVAGIYAIGDIVGGPMLAHKATHEGKAAAEVIAGLDVEFDAKTIPSVAYTDPEVAWMGPTETAARAAQIEYEKAMFPWAASGRALGLGRGEGLTKLLFEPGSRRLLGAGIVGVGAGDLIAETVHALEMGANARGHRADRAPPPHAVGDGGVRGRAGRGHDHRPAGACGSPPGSTLPAEQRLEGVRDVLRLLDTCRAVNRATCRPATCSRSVLA